MSRGLRLLEVTVVVAILGKFYFRNLETVRFHGDESHWIATSCFFEALLPPGFSEPLWLSLSDVPDTFPAPDWLAVTLTPEASSTHVWGAHYWTLTQPMVSRYMIALGRIAGGYGVADLNIPWDFDTADAQNVVTGAMPSSRLLWSSRAMMALLSIISGVLLFLLVRRCVGAIAGYSFVGLYVGSEYLLTHLRRAMSEAPLLFFTTLALLCAVRALSVAPRRLGRAIAWLLLMSVCAGLAGAAKLNGLALGFSAVVLCFVVACRCRDRSAKRWRVAFLAALLVIVVTAGVFIFVNPFLYPQPLLRAIAMVLFRRWEMTRQARNLQWYIPDLSARMRIIPLRIFRDYPAVHIEFFNELLTVLGLYVLARAGWQWLADKKCTAISITINVGTSVAILVIGAVTALPPLLTPLDWDRYYMYPVLFVSVNVAVSVGWFAGQWRRFVALFAEP
ncbi:MAG: phospholipid carrier-dependent glycosyltransferase [Anaerolineae bacterium]|nr:phospholipid carrier-dependent glycosyltransferase [Anaerolineae bacterium]